VLATNPWPRLCRKEPFAVIVSLVRFRSKLPDDEVQALFEDRAHRYRSVTGLLEKLYIRFRDTDEFGAIYVWESEEDLQRFRETDLAGTIPDAYRVDGAPAPEVADVRLVIRQRRNHITI
jgi:heme-degrading monooxygenase HmoA